jgi:hypothetical protein
VGGHLLPISMQASFDLAAQIQAYQAMDAGARA